MVFLILRFPIATKLGYLGGRGRPSGWSRGPRLPGRSARAATSVAAARGFLGSRCARLLGRSRAALHARATVVKRGSKNIDESLVAAGLYFYL